MADELDATHITVRLMELPTRAALATANDTAPENFRRLTIVAVHINEQINVAAGWGECSALNTAGYTNESAAGAYDLLTSGHEVSARTAPLAGAAIEMACLDASLRAQGQSLADHVGTVGQSSVAGSVVGLATVDQTVAQVAEMIDAGYQRVKLKIAPGHLDAVAAVRASFSAVEVHLDANGSFGAADLDQLCALEQHGITAIEQPFPPTELPAASRLVAAASFAVVADEGLLGLDTLRALAAQRACTHVAVKPPKLGGLAVAVSILDEAEELGLGAVIGGMLECGLGRHQLAALAPLSAFTLTGDLSPASRWLAVDPFADVIMSGPTIAAPATIGIAGDPDFEILDMHTIEVETVPLPRRNLVG